MHEYTFTAKDSRGNKLGAVMFERENLPSHLEISLAIVQRYPEATEYTLKDLAGNDMIPTRIRLKNYLPGEFYYFFKGLGFRIKGRQIKFIQGSHAGRTATILEYHQDKYGCLISVEMDDKQIEYIGSTELDNIMTITE